MDANVLNENLKNYFVGKIKSLENKLDEYNEEAQKRRKLNQGVNTFGGRSFPEVENEPLDAKLVARVIQLAMVPIKDHEDEVNFMIRKSLFVSWFI